MPLDDSIKQKLGGPMNLFVDPRTAAVRVLVVGFPDESGNVQLRKDIKGNLQLSPGWVAHLIELLPHDEQVIVIASLMANTILTGISQIDRKTGNVVLLWIEVGDSGFVRVLPKPEGDFFPNS